MLKISDVLKLIVAAAVWILLSLPAQAQSFVRSTGQPDIVVLVVAGPNGQDQIGFTYPSIVARSQAMRDVRAFQAATGLTLRAVKITEDVAPVRGAKIKMTSVEALTTHAISTQAHHFNVEPVVSAFRRYPHMALTYFVDDFSFQGLREWSDSHVQISLDQHGAAYTYQVRIYDPNFRRLNLPLVQPPLLDIRTARAEDSSTQSSVKFVWRFALIGLATVVVGVALAALVARHAR